VQSLYPFLSQESQLRRVDWKRVHLFEGDERCVAPGDPSSHDRAAEEPLLKLVSLPAENVHRIRGEQDPEQAAAAYEQELRAFFGSGENGAAVAAQAFDLILVGMEDGQTAAPLLAGNADGDQQQRWVRPVRVDERSPWWVTLTPVVFHAAENVTVLVSGAANAERLEQMLEGTGKGGPQSPTAAIEPTHGRLRWIADEAAVSRSSSRASRFLSGGDATAAPTVPPSARHFPWVATG